MIAEREVVVTVLSTEEAATKAYVSNETELKAALAGINIDTIIVLADFNVTDTHTINRALTIAGDGHTIIATGAYTAAQPHVLDISSGDSKVTVENLTIDGNENTSIKAGIIAYNSTDVIINNVTIKNCKTVGLQVNNSAVDATNLNISNSGWKCSINVDQGEPSLKFHSGNLEDNVQIYTELVGQDVITVDEATGLKKVLGGGEKTDLEGLKGFEYYTDDMSKLGVAYNVEKNTVYTTVEEAIAKAAAGNTVELLKDATIAAHIDIAKQLTINGNGHKLTGTGTGEWGLLNFVAGSEGSKIENLTINFTSTVRDSAAIMILTEGAIEIDNVIFNGAATLNEIHQESAIITAVGVAANLKVTNCEMKNFKYGMYVNKAGNLTVKGNTINGTNYNGINVASAAAEAVIEISDNTLTGISAANYSEPQFSAGISLGAGVSATMADNDIAMLNGKLPVYPAE